MPLTPEKALMKEHTRVKKKDGSEPGCCSPRYATSVVKTLLNPVPALSWGESACFWLYSCCCSLVRWKLQWPPFSCCKSLLSSTDVDGTIFEMTSCWHNTTVLSLPPFEPLPATVPTSYTAILFALLRFASFHFTLHMHNYYVRY